MYTEQEKGPGRLQEAVGGATHGSCAIVASAMHVRVIMPKLSTGVCVDVPAVQIVLHSMECTMGCSWVSWCLLALLAARDRESKQRPC